MTPTNEIDMIIEQAHAEEAHNKLQALTRHAQRYYAAERRRMLRQRIIGWLVACLGLAVGAGAVLWVLSTFHF